MGIGQSSLVSPAPGKRQPIQLVASTSLANVPNCACNGLCALFAVEENLRGLESGNTIESDTTIQDLEAWSSTGCPLAKFLLSSTVGAGTETGLAMRPSFFKMMIWHKRDPRSGFRHQAFNFEIPDSNHEKVKFKYAEIYAVPGSPSANFLKQRIGDPDLSSDESFDLAGSWIEDCLHNHSACRRDGSKGVLPVRVIEVLPPSGPDTVRLHVSDGQEADTRYAALSYCWGKQQTCVTTTASLSANLGGMPLSSLHGTIRDAVLTTRKLSIPYLWVDALCIIQDSDDDKAVEISKMGGIYTNAIVTISAAGANDCDEGFLIMRRDMKERYDQRSEELPYLCPDGTVGKIYLVPTGYDYLNHDHAEVIYERAWTHQERMLSPRMLTFGHRKLSWQCLTSSHCDFDIEDLNFSSATLDIRKFLHSVSVLSTNAMSSPSNRDLPDKAVLQHWWREVVHGYSQGRLSVLPDKLIALSATARRFASALQSQYVYGLWHDDLVRGMMWYSYRTLRIRHPDHFRRPGLASYTWSWASVNGPVAYPQAYLEQSPTFTATASYLTFGDDPNVSFSDSFKVYLRLESKALGPFAWEHLSRFFPSRTLDYENEEPNGSGMGCIYPDENDELLYTGLVQDDGSHAKHEYWLFELSRMGRVRNGLVLRLTDSGAFKRAGFYSVNTLLPEEYQREWESVAVFRDVLVL